MKYIKYILCLWALLALPVSAAGSGQDGEINVKELVFEHLADAYEWHFCNIGDKEIALHLPVIVIGRNSGFHVFSSARLAHHAEWKGFYITHEGEYAGKVVERDDSGGEVRPLLDLSLTKNALALIINSIVLLLFVLPLVNAYRKDPLMPSRGLKGALEVVITTVQDEVIKPCVGEDYRKFSPYLLTAFFFILINNLMGLVPFFPGGANTTGNIAVTIVLALCTFFTVNIFGTKEYWEEILWPEVPIWLKVPVPLMPAIELFGIFTKPFALMIRLFANIMAGHSIILGLVCLIFVITSMGAAINAGLTVVSVLFTIFMNFVEILIAFIQAYIFTLLSAVFIGAARVKHSHHKK
ncbi:MAG: F0F1 ATP synthase subunit A [Tannerellaceae bacterium]|nr:F0F1 ATP synthase subunit A [Tannerellaceae bacterium]MCD8263870.1 F0F1 ATP synthase subunit A [Tannerellaceae bacterium]